MDNRKCEGKHSVYVAEVVYVQKDGILWVINVCRSCGVVSFHPKEIATPGSVATFLKQKEKEQEHEL